MSEHWQIDGADGEPILGDAHVPRGAPTGVVLIAHGFKGYKDYGMFPAIAGACAAAGLIAHRFNFSHSGMTNDLDTFARPDLFERDTWNRQVQDLNAVTCAVNAGELNGGGLPQVWFGHSRGGVTVLLAAGRRAAAHDDAGPAGIVTAAAPSTCCSLDDDARRQLLEDGHLDSPSSRTGQTLRVGRAFLQEQLDDPAAHDLLGLVAKIECPLLVVHGDADPTVPAASAQRIADAARSDARVVLIPGANHVFDTPNPMPPDAEPGPALAAQIAALVDFAGRCCSAASARP